VAIIAQTLVMSRLADFCHKPELRGYRRRAWLDQYPDWFSLAMACALARCLADEPLGIWCWRPLLQLFNAGYKLLLGSAPWLWVVLARSTCRCL